MSFNSRTSWLVVVDQRLAVPCGRLLSDLKSWREDNSQPSLALVQTVWLLGLCHGLWMSVVSGPRLTSLAHKSCVNVSNPAGGMGRGPSPTGDARKKMGYPLMMTLVWKQ